MTESLFPELVAAQIQANGPHRECRQCDRVLPLSAFYDLRGPLQRYGQRAYTCKSCSRRYNSGRRDRAYTDLAVHGNYCWVCGALRSRGAHAKLQVDHVGSTNGPLRGLLCDDCNSAASRCRSNPEIAERLVLYLRGDMPEQRRYWSLKTGGAAVTWDEEQETP